MNPWKLKLVRSSTEALPSKQPIITKPDEPEPVATPSPQSSSWVEDKQLSLFVLLGLTAITGYLTYIIFRPFLTALVVAIVMAIAFSPPHKWISRRVRNRYVAALITTLLAMLLVLVPLLLVSARLALAANSNYRSFLNQHINTANWPAQLDPLIEQVADRTGMPVSQLRAEVNRRARELGTRLVAIAGTLAQRFAQQMMTLLLGSVFLFSLLRSSDELKAGAIAMLPLSPNRARELAATVYQGIVANIYGMLAVGLVEGILIAIGFWVAGLRSPLVWGAIATILSVLPYVGVSLVWIPACAMLVLRGHWVNAITLAIWAVIVVSTADGIIRGSVISGRVKTNSLLITLSLMGGLAVFGPIGFFVGPVTVVVFASLIRILREEHAAVRTARNQAA
jgi:predicted PurR-regulated permease PerM